MAAVCDICGKAPGFGKSLGSEHPECAGRRASRRQQAPRQRVHVVHQGRQGRPRLEGPMQVLAVGGIVAAFAALCVVIYPVGASIAPQRP
jgi:hypothetical protein